MRDGEIARKNQELSMLEQSIRNVRSKDRRSSWQKRTKSSNDDILNKTERWCGSLWM